MRRIGQALAFVPAFLIIVAEVQRADEALAQREAVELFGARGK